jgi:hypothetical protein
VCQYGCLNNQQCCQNTNRCAACCSDQECNDGIACTVDKCGSAGCTHTPDASLCPTANYQCLPGQGCVQCTSNAHCDDGNSCTTDTCNLQTRTCSHISTCECQTGFDCQLIIAKAAVPIPPEGQYCHACVDGKCKSVLCYGSCCSSGCHIGLCPD